MSVLFREPTTETTTYLRSIGGIGGFGFAGFGGRRVRADRARRQSVVWAATRLRADLISLMPVDVFQKIQGVAIEVAKPQLFSVPDYVDSDLEQPMSIGEWMASSQNGLDTTGNAVGIIRSFDGLGKPSRIELVPDDEVSFRIKGRKIVEYRINGTVEDPKYIWHERQFTVPGLPIGLSPIAHAALPLTAGLAAQEWAVSWFENGAVPSAIVRNSEKTVPAGKAAEYKAQYIDKRVAGEPFFVGKDWEYIPVAAKAAESQFIEQMQYTDSDLCRFMGVPADAVDVVVQSGGRINYANITQANLQLLIMHLGGAVKRREDSLTRLTPTRQYVKLNRSAVLAMDPKTRAEVFELRIKAKSITPDQIRAFEDEMPFDEADYAQLERLGLTGNRTPNQPQTAGS